MIVFVADGLRLPVYNMFSVDGQETTDPNEAIVIVAANPDGTWLATEVFDGELIQSDKALQ